MGPNAGNNPHWGTTLEEYLHDAGMLPTQEAKAEAVARLDKLRTGQDLIDTMQACPHDEGEDQSDRPQTSTAHPGPEAGPSKVIPC
jgi:hypothetical protein